MSAGQLDYYDVENIAGDKARQAYYDAVNHTDDVARGIRDDLHISLEDVRAGLSDLFERVDKLERERAS